MNRIRRTEEDEQMAVIEQTKYMLGKYPVLEYLIHIPNGGKRGKAEAGRFKALGVKPGVSDLFLPVKRGPYIGLWIEMKYGKGKTTENQLWWLESMTEQGHYTSVCYTAGEAITALTWYLDLPDRAAY